LEKNNREEKKEDKVYYIGDSKVIKKSKFLKPKDYSEYPPKTEPFIPDFLLKEWMVAAVFLVGFMVFVIASPPPLEEMADSTNTSYLPIPDWYFLFLYQLLKYKWASGKFIVIGTVVLPFLIFGSLLVLPWLDKSPKRSPFQRPIATSIMLLCLITFSFLTWEAFYEHKKQLKSLVGIKPKNTVVVGKEEEGYAIYKRNACVKCHGAQLEGINGPTLLGVGNRRSFEKIKSFIDNGKGNMPPGMFYGSEKEKEILIKWLLKQKQKKTPNSIIPSNRVKSYASLKFNYSCS